MCRIPFFENSFKQNYLTYLFILFMFTVNVSKKNGRTDRGNSYVSCTDDKQSLLSKCHFMLAILIGAYSDIILGKSPPPPVTKTWKISQIFASFRVFRTCPENSGGKSNAPSPSPLISPMDSNHPALYSLVLAPSAVWSSYSFSFKIIN